MKWGEKYDSASATNTPRCDLDVSPDSNLLQNGSPDAVVLLDGAGAIDTVSYGGTTPPPGREGHEREMQERRPHRDEPV